jgi:hypothetical protein
MFGRVICEKYLSGNFSSLDWYFSQIPLPNMIYLYKIPQCRSSSKIQKSGLLRVRIIRPSWSDTITIKIQLSVLVLFNAEIIIISSKCSMFTPWYSWKITHLALTNNHLLAITKWEIVITRWTIHDQVSL